MMRSTKWLCALSGAALLAGCATTGPYYSAGPYVPGTVYVERGENGEPVASVTDREIAAMSAVPPVVDAPVFMYRPPYYAYPYAPWPSYGWPSTSLYFSWNNARPWYPYRSWGGPPPVYHRPVPPVPRAYGYPPAVHGPVPGSSFRPPGAPPPAVGRPPPGGGYRGFFGNRIGPRR